MARAGPCGIAILPTIAHRVRCVTGVTPVCIMTYQVATTGRCMAESRHIMYFRNIFLPIGQQIGARQQKESMCPSSGGALQRVHHAPERSSPDALKGLGGSGGSMGRACPAPMRSRSTRSWWRPAMTEHACAPGTHGRDCDMFCASSAGKSLRGQWPGQRTMAIHRFMAIFEPIFGFQRRFAIRRSTETFLLALMRTGVYLRTIRTQGTIAGAMAMLHGRTRDNYVNSPI
jgi:hypothetical protein